MKKKPAFTRSLKTPVALAAMLFLLPLAAPVSTQATEINALQGLVPMSKSQLSKYRGGFKVGNYEIALGVDIKGWVDGVLKTTVNLTVGNLSAALGNGASHTVEAPHIDVADLNLPDTGDAPDAGDAAGAAGTISSLNLQASTPDELARLLVQHGIANNIIANNKDGAKIEQVTKLTLAVTNFQALNPAAIASLGNLQTQLKGLSGFGGLQ